MADLSGNKVLSNKNHLKEFVQGVRCSGVALSNTENTCGSHGGKIAVFNKELQRQNTWLEMHRGRGLNFDCRGHRYCHHLTLRLKTKTRSERHSALLSVLLYVFERPITQQLCGIPCLSGMAAHVPIPSGKFSG
jgi:hypothetical protein